MSTLDPYPCGPASWKGRIPWCFRIHVPQFVYRNDCRFHDLLYDAGGTPKDRKSADDLFYGLMKRALSGRPWISRRYFGFWAWVYWRAVRVYGKKAYHYRTEHAGKGSP